MYVCGEYVMVTNALSQGNTVDGIDLKYALDSGEGANQLGFARRTIIRGNQFRSNGEYGIRAHVEAAFTGTDLGIENATIEGNHCEGNGVHGMICGLVGGVVSGNICVRNIQRGMMFTSCISTSIIGNHAGDNGTTGTNRSGVVFGVGLYAGAGNSRACTIVGNTAADTRSGGDRTALCRRQCDEERAPGCLPRVRAAPRRGADGGARPFHRGSRRARHRAAGKLAQQEKVSTKSKKD